VKHVPTEQNQTGETEEHGRRAVNGQISPLALGLASQVSSALLDSRFQTPVFQKRSHNVLGS
jgi:hypothetical protein